MKQTRFSKQRQAIYDALKSTDTHPTADTLYRALKEKHPELSLGTVYRNLRLFIENKQAIQINVGDQVEHYDANTIPHYHFYCRNCCALLDVDVEYDDTLVTKVTNQTNLDIDSYSTIFYGTCKTCKN